MYQFGSFIFVPEQLRLLRKDSKQEVEIDHKLSELLALFIQQPNTILSRQIILDSLWAGSIVTDNAINKLIANLRKALGDDVKKPQYIQTVPKRGYRFISEVNVLASPVVEQTQQGGLKQREDDEKFQPTKANPYTKKLASLLLVVVGFYLWQGLIDKPSIDSRYSVALTRASGAERSAQMHPDGQHLYYLKSNEKSAQNELWIKNIHSAITKQADTAKAQISEIIAIIESEGHSTSLVYLDKNHKNCNVYQAVISVPSYVIQTQQKLFNCAGKRIKDFAFNTHQYTLYYSAQPKNFWPNQVYAFNLDTKKHLLITQSEPKGWGHHNIDVSPNGSKLLIMSTNSDYKTQVLSLNLLNDTITEGVKFSQPVTEAIWHHDSEQIYYYAAEPAQQIMRSEFNGDNAVTVVSVSEQLSSNMSRFPDGKNILFSTEQKNMNNRWLMPEKKVGSIDNSTVDDSYPVLFHHSEQYLFVSKRNGRSQLYLANNNQKKAQIVTNFVDAHWLGYIAIAGDDKSLLVNMDNKIYLLGIDQLNTEQPLISLPNKQLIYNSANPIIALDWLSTDKVAVTVVINANPELVVIRLPERTIEPLEGQWAYGFSDSAHPHLSYVIEQHSNQLYRFGSHASESESLDKKIKFTDTKITLPKGFYHAKIDDKTLFYVTTENDNEYLHSVSLTSGIANQKYRLHTFSSYDVSKGNIMLSDMEKLEGDVHRTIH